MAEIIFSSRGPSISNAANPTTRVGTPVSNDDETFLGQRGTPTAPDDITIDGRRRYIAEGGRGEARANSSASPAKNLGLPDAGTILPWTGPPVENDPDVSFGYGGAIFPSTEVQYYGIPASSPPSPVGVYQPSAITPSAVTTGATGWSFSATGITFNAPRAADTNSLFGTQLPQNGPIAVANPDVPRKLRVKVVSAAAPNDLTGGMLTIVGTDANGRQVADCFNLEIGPSATVIYASDRAFATITDASLSGVTFTGAGAGSTIEIGVDVSFGLPVNRPPVQLMVPTSVVRSVLMPAYFRPGYSLDGWSGMGWTAIMNTPLIDVVIVNPGTTFGVAGPGSTGTTGALWESVYRTVIQGCRAAGKKVIGYTYGSWGVRNPTAIKGDVDIYYGVYAPTAGIDGIFIDEGTAVTGITTGVSLLSFYGTVASQIRGYNASALIGTLTGSTTDGSIMQWCDFCISYESSPLALPVWPVNDFQFQVPSTRNGIVMHSCTSVAQVLDAVARAKSLNFGRIMTTTFVTPDSWSGVPTAPVLNALCTAIACPTRETIEDSLVLYTIANDVGNVYVDAKYNKILKVATNQYPRIYLDIATSGIAIGGVTGVTARLMMENSNRYRWNTGSGTFQSFGTTTASINTAYQYRNRISRASFDNVKTPINVVFRSQEYYAAWPYTRYTPAVYLPSQGLASSGAQPFLAPTAWANNTPIAIATTDYYGGTVTPTMAPDGATKFDFSYVITADPT